MEDSAQTSPEQNPPPPPVKKSGSGRRLLLIFVILILLGGLFWFSQFGFFNPFSQEPDNNFTPPSATKSAKPKWPEFTREELIESFVTSALVDRKGNEVGASRWVKPSVSVSFSNQQPQFEETLAGYIKEFNAISPSVKLTAVENPKADVVIHMVGENEFLASAKGDDVLIKAGGFASPKMNQNCELQFGNIYINTEKNPNLSFLKLTIWHEMDHIIGFWGHNKLKTCSFNSILCQRSDLSEVDKNFIDMLYNSGLPLCTKPATARTYLLRVWQKKYNED